MARYEMRQGAESELAVVTWPSGVGPSATTSWLRPLNCTPSIRCTPSIHLGVVPTLPRRSFGGFSVAPPPSLRAVAGSFAVLAGFFGEVARSAASFRLGVLLGFASPAKAELSRINWAAAPATSATFSASSTASCMRPALATRLHRGLFAAAELSAVPRLLGERGLPVAIAAIAAIPGKAVAGTSVGLLKLGRDSAGRA